MSGFRLHPRLAADCAVVGEGPLSRFLLLDDRRYPWLILVPRIDGVTGLHELDVPARGTLMDECCRAARALESLYAPDRVNVGALGNLVPQLHLHVIARHEGDPAWPGPVWGHSDPESYAPADRAKRLAALRDALKF
ncbi:MAG: HIT domain-containing protein [Gammaproteobacteria bacterium]